MTMNQSIFNLFFQLIRHRFHLIYLIMVLTYELNNKTNFIDWNNKTILI